MSAISTGRVLTEKEISGRVNVRLAVMQDGKPTKGSRSFNIENMTASEAYDYIIAQDTLACAVQTLAEERGVSTDELLSSLSANTKAE
jgi:hypothetical protein